MRADHRDAVLRSDRHIIVCGVIDQFHHIIYNMCVLGADYGVVKLITQISVFCNCKYLLLLTECLWCVVTTLFYRIAAVVFNRLYAEDSRVKLNQSITHVSEFQKQNISMN